MSTLQTFSEQAHRTLLDYFGSNEERCSFIDLCLDVSWVVTFAIIDQYKEVKNLLWPCQMLQTLHGYMRNSITFLMTGKLDEGMAVLRMAAELARDLKILWNTPELIDLWQKKEKDDVTRNHYRRTFKFDSSIEGKSALRLYQLTCKYGIHGHMTTLVASAPITKTGDGEYIVFQVSDESITRYTEIWLVAYMSVYSYLFDWNKLPQTEEFVEYGKSFFVLLREAEKFIGNRAKVMKNWS